MDSGRLKRLKELEAENRHPGQMFADAALDIRMLKDALQYGRRIHIFDVMDDYNLNSVDSDQVQLPGNRSCSGSEDPRDGTLPAHQTEGR